MVRQDVAPCMDCGARPAELDHFARGRHTYSEWQIFPDLPDRLVLCEFCEADFPSYDAAYFGIRAEVEPGQYRKFVRARTDVAPLEDWVCPECVRRQGFVDFVARARRAYAGSPPVA